MLWILGFAALLVCDVLLSRAQLKQDKIREFERMEYKMCYVPSSADVTYY